MKDYGTSRVTVFLPCSDEESCLVHSSETGEEVPLERFLSDVFSPAHVIIPLSCVSVAFVSLPGTVAQKKKALPYALEKYLLSDISSVFFLVCDWQLESTLVYWVDRSWLLSALEQLKKKKLSVGRLTVQSLVVAPKTGYRALRCGAHFFLVRSDGFFWRLDSSGYVWNRLCYEQNMDPKMVVCLDEKPFVCAPGARCSSRPLVWWKGAFKTHDNWMKEPLLRRFSQTRNDYQWLSKSARRFFSGAVFFFGGTLIVLAQLLYNRSIASSTINKIEKSVCTAHKKNCFKEKRHMLSHKHQLIDENDFLPIMAILQKTYASYELPVVSRIQYDASSFVFKVYYDDSGLSGDSIPHIVSFFHQWGYVVGVEKKRRSTILVIDHV